MQKYLDDFEDDIQSPVMDWVEWLIPRIIAARCIVDIVRTFRVAVKGGESDDKITEGMHGR